LAEDALGPSLWWPVSSFWDLNWNVEKGYVCTQSLSVSSPPHVPLPRTSGAAKGTDLPKFHCPEGTSVGVGINRVSDRIYAEMPIRSYFFKNPETPPPPLHPPPLNLLNFYKKI